MCKHKNNSAFTLVELSIVIVIIGLLIASTLVGKAMLASSEVKTMLAEVQKLNTAVSSFQSLYKALPGDMPNATKYWGVYDNATKVNATVNGDGNGKIEAETNDEPFRALQQLYLANLLEGNYAKGAVANTTYSGFTGQWNTGLNTGFTLSSASVVGNVIGSRARSGAALYIKCCSGTDYSPATRTIMFKNHISLFSINADITKRNGILTPVEAFDTDRKIDDGLPDTGLVGASGSWAGGAYAATSCYSGSGSASTYDTAVAANKNQPNCQMQFAYHFY